MAKRVFFSFHYQDVVDLRANVVRNHWRTKPDREAGGFFDASIWESARRTGEDNLKRLIKGASSHPGRPWPTLTFAGSAIEKRPIVAGSSATADLARASSPLM